MPERRSRLRGGAGPGSRRRDCRWRRGEAGLARAAVIWVTNCRRRAQMTMPRLRPGVRRAGLPRGVRAAAAWCRGRAGAPAAGGARARLSSRRGRCGSCRATHIVLPSWMASRLADGVGVIAAGAVASALHGTGSGRIGADLGVPARTLRRPLRRRSPPTRCARTRWSARPPDRAVRAPPITVQLGPPHPFTLRRLLARHDQLRRHPAATIRRWACSVCPLPHPGTRQPILPPVRALSFPKYASPPAPITPVILTAPLTIALAPP